MKRLGLALAAAAALFTLPLADSAAAGTPPPPPTVKAADVKITPADKVRGMKEAPPLVAASDVKTCQITDAALRGSGTSKSPDGKTVKATLYEVVCQTGLGYLVSAPENQPKPQMINCIIASAAQGLKCALPQNLDVKKGLGDYVQQAARTCAISQQRYVGSNTSGANYYEVGCTGASGFLISANDGGGAPQAIDCQAVQGTPQACQFTSKTQILAAYQPAVAKSGKACQISDVRPVGADKTSGDIFTEIACTGSPGFVLQQDSAGAFRAAIDCDRAERIGGGCKLTDVAAAQASRTGGYAKLAAAAGFSCQVSNSRYIGQDANKRDVVELACSDRPDGAVAAFSETGKSDIYDCVRARALGGSTCTLTQASAVYPRYTELMATRSHGTCKASGANYLGSTSLGSSAKTDYVETVCDSGVRGFVIGFKAGTTSLSTVLSCSEAAEEGLPCEMPANAPHNK